MKCVASLSTAVLLALTTQQSMAADITIEVQNLSHGLYFTPIAAVAPQSPIYLPWVKPPALNCK
jgi:hypothetical protein